MCTQEEVKNVVEEILHDPNDDGETVIGREVNRHLDAKAKDIVYRLTLRFAVPFVGLVFIGAGAWYTLQGSVARHTKLLEEGDRWTQEEQDRYMDTVSEQMAKQSNEISALRTDYDELAKELRTDLKSVLNILYTNKY